MDEVTLTLSSPITEGQWDMIADYDFNYTNEITFNTKHGKTVRFVKESAQPEQRWIPCSERLPEENIKVLVTDKDGYIDIAYYCYNEWSEDPKIEWWAGGFRAYPIAWMLLPKPYKDFSEHMNEPEEE